MGIGGRGVAPVLAIASTDPIGAQGRGILVTPGSGRSVG